ncbi:MAG: hypothetical protein F2737_12080 [Actinobacteria bacterium]|uniref:Unannotated protein n=1 Tax=freshwater metagenome TaxID=449393 RepID=A0A6J6ZXD8_9ZZZZ|nr:hypothetical protein [Actinomycetota bacterium]
MGYRTRMQIAAGAGARCFHSNRVSRTLIGAALALVATVVGLVPSPAASTALSKPARPAVAGSNTALSVAAAEALAALWARDDTYADKLAVVVPLVAVAGKVSAGRLADAWSTASRQRMIALLSALTQVGVPYRARRAAAGVGFDCSGLTSWAWAQGGRYLPHQSLRQIRTIRRSTKAEVLPADLLYYPGHVMLALGVGAAMVHAPYPGRSVEVSPATGRWERIVRVGTPDGQRAVAPGGSTAPTTTQP